MHEIGYIVPDKQDAVNLLAQVQGTHQKQRDGDAAVPAGQHDKPKHNAGRAEQRSAGEQHALQDAGHQRRDEDAAEQRPAAVAFLQGRGHNQEQQHIVQEVIPVGVAQHMAEQPHIEQRVGHRAAIYAEQVGGRPAVRQPPQRQGGQRQKEKRSA